MVTLSAGAPRRRGDGPLRVAGWRFLVAPETRRAGMAESSYSRRRPATASPCFPRAGPAWSFEFTHFAVHGDVLLAEWDIAIERRQGGRRIAWRGMSVAEIRDGLIRWWREYWNPADLA